MQQVKKWGKRLLFLLPALAAALMYWILPHFPEVTESVFSGFLFKVVAVPLGLLISVLPFSMTEMLVIAAVPAVILLVILWVRRLKRSSNRRRLLAKTGRLTGWLLSSLLLLYMVMHGMNFYRLPVSELMGLDMSAKSPEFLTKVCIDLADKASAEREYLQEDDNGCTVLSQSVSETLRLADNGYRKLDDRYPFLWGGVWRAKPVQLSHWWSYTGITGMYFPFFAEANVNIDVPDSSIPSTVSHELAHTRGFAREDECNFFAFLASTGSDSADFRYSGYVSAFIYCSNALYAYDQELWKEARSHCSEGMERDLHQRNVYWEQFEGRVQEVSTSLNDSFISAQGDEDGVLSYDRVVSLILAYYEKEELLGTD